MLIIYVTISQMCYVTALYLGCDLGNSRGIFFKKYSDRIIPKNYCYFFRKNSVETFCKFRTRTTPIVTDWLWRSAADNVVKADEIRTLVKDVWDIRMAKLRSSVDVFLKSDATHAKVDTYSDDRHHGHHLFTNKKSELMLVRRATAAV